MYLATTSEFKRSGSPAIEHMMKTQEKEGNKTIYFIRVLD